MKAIPYELDTKPFQGLIEEIKVQPQYYDENHNRKYINRTVILKAEVIDHSPATAALIKMYEQLRQKIWGAADDYLTAYRELGCQGDSGRRYYGISGYDKESGNLVLFAYGWQGGGFNNSEKYCCLPYYYSHFLGVDPGVPGNINGKPVLLNYRSSGLGVQAKKFIDKIVEKEGLFANVWTVNPLLGANASMNFSQYGADVLLFDPNHYGPMTGFNIGLRTDRFVLIKPLQNRPHSINPGIKEKIIAAVRESWDEYDAKKNKINRVLLNPLQYVPAGLTGKKSPDTTPAKVPGHEGLYSFFFAEQEEAPVAVKPGPDKTGRHDKEIELCRSILKNVAEDPDPGKPGNTRLIKKICSLPLNRDDDFLVVQIPGDFDKDCRLNPVLARENQLLYAILFNRYVKERNYGVSFMSVTSPAEKILPGTKRERFNFYILEKGKGLCSYKDLPYRPPGTAAFIKNRLKQRGIDITPST